jgi:capsular polysaccharide biosynthesis protein
MNLTESVLLLVFTVIIVIGTGAIIFLIQNPTENGNNQIVLNEQTCNSNGGNWNSCGNKCQILNVNNEEIACTQVCEALCECGTIAGLTCPQGYNCKMPENISDAKGYCVKK